MGTGAECVQQFLEVVEEMSNFDVKAIREELENALSRKFDTSRGIAVYGAGDTSTRYSDIFAKETQNIDGGGITRSTPPTL